MTAVESNLMFCQEKLHTFGNAKPEGAPSRKKQSMNTVNQVQGVQRLCAAGCGRSATNIDAGGGSTVGQDDCAARWGAGECGMTNPYASDSCNGIVIVSL
jgi:hypothetical protein